MDQTRGSKLGTTLFIVLCTLVSTGAARGVHRSDPAIKADLRRSFGADRSLDDSSIVVLSVKRGVVVLGGTAASADDVVRALATASGRPGVRRVSSRIRAQDRIAASSRVRPVLAPAAAQHAPADLADDEIRRGVSRALFDLDAKGNANIRVAVTDGVVRLMGTVSSWDGNDARLSAVRSVTGVRSILNEVEVDAPRGERR